MPIVNGNYNQLTAEDIRASLEDELQNEFGEDIDLTQSSVFQTLATVLGQVVSNNQEQSLEEVYESSFLDTATGIDLDRVVAIIGIQRRSAEHATGVERFYASQPVQSDYVIQRGTALQTAGDPTIEFETTQATALELVDSFEDGDINEWSGDTGNGSVVTDSNAPNGSEVLQMDATADTHIYNSNITFEQGTKFHAHVRPNASTIPALTFAVDAGTPGNRYQIEVDEANDTIYLTRYDTGTRNQLDSQGTLGMTTGSFHEVEVDWTITNNISATIYDPDGNELGTVSATDDTYQEGVPGFASDDANGAKEFDFYTMSEVSANIRAVRGGEEGNVGPDSITELVSPPSGVDRAKNIYPTANTSYKDLNGEQLVIGEAEESDEELRDRAKDAVTGGGDATHDALVHALRNETEGVSSVTIFQNKTDVDNTGSGGLPPYSFEAVVFGGDDADVAETIFETKAVTARDYSGANGTSTSQQVTADSNGQTRTVEWSRPSKTDVDMTLDIAVDESYIGNDALRDKVTSYIGGTLSDGTSVVGLGVNEDVRIDAIRDIVVGDENGVVGFDQSVDADPISTTPSVTTVNGLKVIDIGGTEVAQTDASDGSITLNTREV